MEQIDAPIICDSNIWYDLSDGTIDPAIVSKKRLIGTFISAYELCSTRYALHNYTKLRDAIISFRENAVKVYPEAPVEYMKMISNSKSIIPEWAKISKAMDIVIKNEHITASDKDRNGYNHFHEDINDSLKPFNELVERNRKEINKNKKIIKKAMSTPQSRLAHKEITKQVITNLVGGVSLDWDRLELFLNTFDEWLRQLALHPSLKMTANDWNDVFNLVYVQPGSLYWTKDEKKTKGFIRNCGCGHYLYEPE